MRAVIQAMSHTHAIASARSGNRIRLLAFNALAGVRRLVADSIPTQEDTLRTLFFTALFSVAISAAAFADASVAGSWHAKMDNGVVIDMNVTADGAWNSKAQQGNQVVRQLRGTYKQTPGENGAGTLVFTPTQASIKNGTAQVETDQYEVAENGKQLKLTSEGDTMVFEKR